MAHIKQVDSERSLSEWKAWLQSDLKRRDTDSPEVSLTSTPPPTLRAEPGLHAVHDRSLSRPLIDQVSNRWRNEKRLEVDTLGYEDDDRELRFCDLEDDSSCPNTAKDLLKSRRFRRMIVIIIAGLLVCYYGWDWYLKPRFQEEWGFKEGFLRQRLNGTYGISRGGDFQGTRVKEIDKTVIPGGEADAEGRRRLVFVGDIHGCKDELVALLDKVGFDSTRDHLIATGDVTSKGPDSLGVLDELIRLNAESVRGNHEDRSLELAKIVLGSSSPPASESATSKGHAKDAKLLLQMEPRHLRYIRDMPLMLRVPALPQATSALTRKGETAIKHEMIVVHAGLVPRIPLDRQDPYFVMNMRSIDHRTHVPSALRSTTYSRPWYEMWNWYNDRLSRGRSLQGFFTLPVPLENKPDEVQGWYSRLLGASKAEPTPRVVVYGHDSKAGLQLHHWSKGLDTTCVAGGKLTALVVNADGSTELVSVKCKDYKS